MGERQDLGQSPAPGGCSGRMKGAEAAGAEAAAAAAEEEEEDSLEQAMGFMFDSSHARVCASFTPAGCLAPIRLRMIKGDPGHVQSGQYLWPAAQYAAGWLLSRRSVEPWLGVADTRVVELGAGCGLAGLALSQLESVTTVILTDYDYGSIELLQENIAEARNLPHAAQKTLLVEKLKWGPGPALPPATVSALAGAGALLVVGTDLIYSQDVVLPLLQTVRLLLQRGGADDATTARSRHRFVLFSSFDISAYDAEVTKVCGELGLEKQELETLDETALPKRSRVQVFISPKSENNCARV